MCDRRYIKDVRMREEVIVSVALIELEEVDFPTLSITPKSLTSQVEQYLGLVAEGLGAGGWGLAQRAPSRAPLLVGVLATSCAEP